MLKCFSRAFLRKTIVIDVILGNQRSSFNRQVIIYSNSSLSYQEKAKSHRNGSERINFVSRSFLLMAGVASLLRNDQEMESGEEKIIHMIKLAKLSHQRKDFKKSEQFLHLALRTAYELQHHQARKYIIDEMANNAFDTGNLQKAEHLFKDMLKLLLSDGMQPDDLAIIHISAKLASLYASFNDDLKAKEGFQFCANHLEFKIKQQLVEDFDTLALYSLVLFWFGEFVFSRGRLTESIELFKQSHGISVRINGPSHPHSLILLNYLANSYSALSKYDEAVECLKSAIILAKETGNNQTEELDENPLPHFHVNLANVYLIQFTSNSKHDSLISEALLKGALESCQEALQLSRKFGNREALIESEKCMATIKKYQISKIEH